MNTLLQLPVVVKKEPEDVRIKSEIDIDFEPCGNQDEPDIEMDWREANNTHVSKYSYLFNYLMDTSHKQDVVLIVGQPAEKIYVHSFILCMNSKFLSESMRAVNRSTISEFIRWQVSIPSINSEIFSSVLQFMYTEKVAITRDNMIEILKTAIFLEIKALEQKSMEFVKEQTEMDVTNENVISLFQVSSTSIELSDLRKRTLKFILENAKVLLKSSQFLSLNLEDICCIFEHDKLEISEMDLFFAAKRWAAHACRKRLLPASHENLRFILDKALYLIRFPLVVLEEFREHVCSTNILTESEILNLLVGTRSSNNLFSSTKRISREPQAATIPIVEEHVLTGPSDELFKSLCSSEQNSKPNETTEEDSETVANINPIALPTKTNYLSAGLRCNPHMGQKSKKKKKRKRIFPPVSQSNYLSYLLINAGLRPSRLNIRQAPCDYALPYDIWCLGKARGKVTEEEEEEKEDEENYMPQPRQQSEPLIDGIDAKLEVETNRKRRARSELMEVNDINNKRLRF